jgi:hypothetical protein
VRKKKISKCQISLKFQAKGHGLYENKGPSEANGGLIPIKKPKAEGGPVPVKSKAEGFIRLE